MRQIRLFLPFVLLGAGIFCLFSCVNPLDPPPVIEPERAFWAIDVEKGRTPYYPYYSYYRCSSSLLATGDFCLVYGEDALNIPEAFAREVANEFDNKIYSKITGAFGSPSDMDRNGRVIILLLNIEEDTSDGSYTAGYFYANDLVYDSYSNRGELLYINYKPANLGNLYSAMAHEFQHLINGSLHLYPQYHPMDTWIDEGLASAAEYLYGGHQTDRIDWFNGDEQGTIRKGNNFFIWNGYWEGYLKTQPSKLDRLSNYATAYLFFQWLRIHADNDIEIYRDIINSLHTDYQAVTSAARLRIPAFSGIDDDEAVWVELLGAWYAANRLRATEEDNIYGYKNEITLNFNWSYSAANHKVSLYPGEGVYSQISGTITENLLEGSNIRYLGLNASGDPVSPPGNSTYLLTYNGSVDDEGSAQNGYAADMIPVPALRSAAAAGSGGISESPEAILRRWDGGRVFLEKLQEGGISPQN
jgi:hypothetical protein